MEPTGQSRPWTAFEIAERIPALQHRMDEALCDLAEMGAAAARAKWTYEKRSAIAYATVQGRNTEQRKANAMLHQHEMDDGSVKTTCTFGYEMDLAAQRYANQKKIVDAIDSELRVLQTLLVSARHAP